MTQGNAPLSVALADKNILHLTPTDSMSEISLRTTAENRVQINKQVMLLAQKAPEISEWTSE